MASSGVRLSDLMVSLSLATDLGFGQPSEHMLRASRISMTLGTRLGLATSELATLYDVSLLTYVGCPVYGNEASMLFGDDIDFRAHTYDADLAGFAATVFMLRRAGSGTSALNRARQVAALMATGGRAVVEQMANHCSAAGSLAKRLGLSADVQAGIEQAYARWDGHGVPASLSGDALSLSARVAHVAEACEVFQRTAGVDAAMDVVRARSGSHFDPAVVEAATRDPVALFDGIDQDTVEEVLAAEPIERRWLTDSELDHALKAIGDFCDLRCPYFAGHARGTATVAGAAAELLNMSPDDTRLLYRAALVHDVGRFGVPGTVWDKPTALAGGDLERMRLHVYYVERIFSRPEPLRQVGRLAAMHHERLDGSGYHRGLTAAMLNRPARLLAAADAYHAMTQRRAHRAALASHDAASRLRSDANEGKLDHDAVDAVLETVGYKGTGRRTAAQGGLTARECEVLRLLTVGLPNKAIARRLGISVKTVGNHVEHVYAKLGVSNRAAAAMSAMELGLVTPGLSGEP